jgi:hypothetical protein
MDFLNNQIKFAKDQARNLRNKIASMNYQKLQFEIIFCINSGIENARLYGAAIYNEYYIVALMVDLLQYVLSYIFAAIQRRKIEPLSKNWSCVSMLTKSYFNYKNFNHSYVEIYDTIPPIVTEDVNSVFASLYHDVFSIVDNENSICDSLVTYKYDDMYIHRVIVAEKKTFSDENYKVVLDESDVKFLSIEYYSKLYNQPRILELKNEEYLVNNELLSATFVKRLLEYQIPYHIFDKDYEISILDNNLQTTRLKFGEYIKLNKTDYSVLKTSDFYESVSSESTKYDNIGEESSKEIIFRETFGR